MKTPGQLSVKINRRDAYGGDAAARVRFPAEVLAAVKAAVGDRLAILAKINLIDGVRGGATTEDAVVTARALEAAGADMLVLSGGRNIESSWQIFGSPLPYDDLAAMQPGWLSRLQFRLLKMQTPKNFEVSELYFLSGAERVRAATSVPLCYVGGVRSLDAARTALAGGFAAIQMARALVHDPALIGKWRAGTTLRSGCDAGNRCVAAMYSATGTHCVLSRNAIDARLNMVDAA